MTNTDTTTSAAKTDATEAKKTPLQKLQDTFAKRGKLVFMPDEDTSLLMELIGGLETKGKDEKGNEIVLPGYSDWTMKSPETFTGAIFAREKDGSQLRLIAFADKQTALADPLVQDWCFGKYVAAVASAATDPEAYEAQFTVPGGALSMAYDKDAFYFHAEQWIGVLERRGLSKVKPRALQYALESEPFAAAKFPAFKDWDKLIEAMASDAEAHGYSTSFYAHCKATRAIAVSGIKDVHLTDTLDALLSEVSKADKPEEAKEAATS